MWIFLPDGFLSVVADNDDPNSSRLLVRARKREHLTRVFPGCKVLTMMGSDYGFRAWIDRQHVATTMARRLEDLAYGNFKNEVEDDHYHDACLGVWQEMRDFQDRSPNDRKVGWVR
ncbi:MAG: hypothetical protein ACPGSE_00345 [Synechococcus sp.]